jgi:hypothetical protein
VSDELDDVIAEIRLYAIASAKLLAKLGRPITPANIDALADRIELGRHRGAAARLQRERAK